MLKYVSCKAQCLYKMLSNGCLNSEIEPPGLDVGIEGIGITFLSQFTFYTTPNVGSQPYTPVACH